MGSLGWRVMLFMARKWEAQVLELTLIQYSTVQYGTVQYSTGGHLEVLAVHQQVLLVISVVEILSHLHSSIT